MDAMFAGQAAAKVSRLLGREVTPREITALFYRRHVPEHLGPLVGGRRLIRPKAMEVIVAALPARGDDPQEERGRPMADLVREAPLFLVKDLPKLSVIPRRRGGGRMHQRTGFRWTFEGLCGVRLESVMIGGQRYTSIPALERFFAAVTAARARRAAGQPARPPVAPRPASDVNAELDRLGL